MLYNSSVNCDWIRKSWSPQQEVTLCLLETSVHWLFCMFFAVVVASALFSAVVFWGHIMSGDAHRPHELVWKTCCVVAVCEDVIIYYMIHTIIRIQYILHTYSLIIFSFASLRLIIVYLITGVYGCCCIPSQRQHSISVFDPAVFDILLLVLCCQNIFHGKVK